MPRVAVEVLAQRELVVARAPAARVDGRMLEQQQRVRYLLPLAALADVLLERQGVAVGDGAQLAHPELVVRARTLIIAHLLVSSLAPGLGRARDVSYRVSAAGASSSSRMRARKRAASAP